MTPPRSGDIWLDAITVLATPGQPPAVVLSGRTGADTLGSLVASAFGAGADEVVVNRGWDGAAIDAGVRALAHEVA